MKIGIIGLPNSGKTTVFNALTRHTVATGSYASHIGEHHIGQVNVPDPRFDRLVSIYRPKKESPASVEFVDLAGLARGTGKEGGAMDEMLKFIRDVDALIHVVRVFESAEVPHPEQNIDPARDISLMDAEMVLHDLIAVEKRLEKLAKEILRLPKEKRAVLSHEKELLERLHSHLESEKPLRDLPLNADELKTVRGYSYLSLSPLLIILNVGENQISRADSLSEQYRPNPETITLALCAKVEAELGQLSAEDAAVFMADLGIAETAAHRVIREAYHLLGTQSFFTVGETEVHAWTIKRGENALAAAGKIHTDLARGFIRAEVIAFDDLMAAGTWSKARELGKLRLEGKNYIVQDGDVLEIRFNI